MTGTAPLRAATPAAAPREADTSVPLLSHLEQRWSPRSFDPDFTVSDAQLDAMLEAARWAPSALNVQPRRFIVARKGSSMFDLIQSSLMGFNTVWAKDASAFVVAIAEVVSPEGERRVWAEYDLGQSIAHLTVQAQAEGLHTHQMAGVDWDVLTEHFGLTSSLKPITVTAVGRAATADRLPERLAQRERAPRSRLSMAELVLARE